MTRYLHPVFIATARNMGRLEQVWRRMVYCRIDIVYFVFIVFMAEEIGIFILFRFLFALFVLFVVFMAEEIDIAYFVCFICFVCCAYDGGNRHCIFYLVLCFLNSVCCVLFCFNKYISFIFIIIFFKLTVHQQSRRKLISKDTTTPPPQCCYLVLTQVILHANYQNSLPSPRGAALMQKAFLFYICT